jgi:D-alanyl-D-alanine carboxypeptidase (penicillin-binding protein 5/6)
VSEDIKLLVPTFGGAEISAELVYKSPVEAPVRAGQQMGELVIARPELPEVRVPLVAEADVARGGFAVRLKTAALVLLRKISPSAADTLSAADG